MKRLYLVVKEDLPPGQQAIQACHAFRGFIEAYPVEDQRWFQESNTLVLLSVPDEQAIKELMIRVKRAGVPCSEFREPDLDNIVTALAIAPSGHQFCKRYPLALRR